MSTASKSDGLVVFEVWESRAKQETFMNERLDAAMAQAGAPLPTRSEWFSLVGQMSSLVGRSTRQPSRMTCQSSNDVSVVDAQLSVGAHGSSRSASQPIRSRKILRTRFGS